MNTVTIKVILALDIGSSSIRCSAYEFHDNERPNDSIISTINGCKSIKKISCIIPGTGKVRLHKIIQQESCEYSYEAHLFDEIDDCIGDCLNKLRYHNQNSFSVIAIGITSFAMNLIGLNREGVPVHEDLTMSYACNDIEVTEFCERFKKEIGPEFENELYSRSGAPIHSAYALPQLLHIAEKSVMKELVDQVWKWASLGSLYVSRLTGQMNVPLSYSEASWTGMLNYRTGKWDKEILNQLPSHFINQLPDVEDLDSPWYKVDKKYQTLWPELKNASVFLPVADGACANIGSKCTSPERVAVTIGTSAAARICFKFPILQDDDGDSSKRSDCHSGVEVQRGLFCYRITPSTILVGGALTDGGSIIAWMRELFHLRDEEAWRRVLQMISKSYEVKRSLPSVASQGGIVFLPFLSGERSTGYRSNASGSILGINQRTTASDIIQGAMEGVVLRLKAILELIQSTQYNALKDPSSTKTPCIIASGNALESNITWRQMLADGTGWTVFFDPDTSEGTSRGISLLVAEKLMYHSELPEEQLGNVMETKVSSIAHSYWLDKWVYHDEVLNAVSTTWSRSSTT